MILAIDPGNEQSAYCLINDKTYKPEKFGKENNHFILSAMDYLMLDRGYNTLAIEMIASYGMPVGREVFDTCIWIGRFIEHMVQNYPQCPVVFIERKEVKMNLCQSMRAKDSNIRQALIDRFGIVGTKKNPGWLYGFKADVWSAYAVGVTYIDTTLGEL